MRIMSERRFQEELAKAKEEIYQREQADRRMMEIHHRIDEFRIGKLCPIGLSAKEDA